jgi:hypothetical protein
MGEPGRLEKAALARAEMWEEARAGLEALMLPEVCPYPDLLCTECPAAAECEAVDAGAAARKERRCWPKHLRNATPAVRRAWLEGRNAQQD